MFCSAILHSRNWAGNFLGEPFGMGGILDIGIQADDALVGFAQGHQCRAIGLARRDRFAGRQILIQANRGQTIGERT